MEGWYIRRCPDHYRNYNFFIPSTRGERTTATVSFFPRDFAVPTNSHKDDMARALRDLTATLKHRYHQTPSQSIGDEQMLAIRKLKRIFCPTLKQPTSLPGIPVLLPDPSRAPSPPPPVAEPSQFAIEPSPVPAPTELMSQVPFSQEPVPVSLSPLTQESTSNNPRTTHRYPARFAISQDGYSMCCVSKYVHAANYLASPPTPSATFSEHYATPVIDPVTGQSLEYHHLMKGPDRPI